MWVIQNWISFFSLFHFRPHTILLLFIIYHSSLIYHLLTSLHFISDAALQQLINSKKIHYFISSYYIHFHIIHSNNFSRILTTNYKFKSEGLQYSYIRSSHLLAPVRELGSLSMLSTALNHLGTVKLILDLVTRNHPASGTSSLTRKC
jgi:hypothetical protein